MSATDCGLLCQFPGPPFTPIAADIVSIWKGKFYATLNLKWNDSINNSTTNYIVAVSTDLDNSTKWKTDLDTRTSVVLNVPYNVNHTISVTAVNCIGTGTMVEIKSLNIGELLLLIEILLTTEFVN